MHFVDAKGILSAENRMNIYRGCLHGCIYCDARSDCYQLKHPFEDIEVKRNAPALLEAALRKKRKKCMISTGSMSDPYIPIEQELGMTRQCLEIIERYGFGLSIQTKSDRILRDLDLLSRIHRNAKCVVQMTLTTYDERLCRILEPNVCTTGARFEVLKRLKEAGIPTVVWISPLLPWINDTEENLRGILDYCVKAGVWGVLFFDAQLTLRKGDREYFYAKLDTYFPGLRERYIRTYGDRYELYSERAKLLHGVLDRTCAAHNICCNAEQVFAFAGTLPEKAVQLSLLEESEL